MPVRARRSATGKRASRRFGLAIVAVGVGIAAALGQNVAWADNGHSDTARPSPSNSRSGTGVGPTKSADSRGTPPSRSSTPTKTPDSQTNANTPVDPAPGTRSVTRHSVAAQLNLRAQRDSSPAQLAAIHAAIPTNKPVIGVKDGTAKPDSSLNSPLKSRAQWGTAAAAPTIAQATAVITSTTSNISTPSDPGPLSPIARIIALPGRIINTVLQALDLTVSVNGPKSPLDFAPIDEALFAAFRRLEDAVGLTKPPAVQPVLLAQTYTGPTTAKTPTVAQFLNAAAAEYVLGGTPGGLKPFTVNGMQMKSIKFLSGESAQVWVTPQQQIIIAYQGTTGGTNLLFHPLIALSQLVTDLQVAFTKTTPRAFTDALAFEQQVEAAAAAQGYSTSDIFLTGHSLGGWEAEYVAQQTDLGGTDLGGMGFEGPGINTAVPGNGAESGFVNIETYGDTAAYFSTDLPALQPFMPAYVPGGGTKPHYGSIVLIGEPDAVTPLINASSLWGTNLIKDAIFGVDLLGNFFEHHLPGMQAYNLGVSPDPGVVPWLGATMGPVETGYANLTIPQLKQAASQAGTLITP